jgi:hypothetical protein
MIRPEHPKGSRTVRVYGTVLAEDFTYLFREVMPSWGSSRRVVAHLIHILANHVRAHRIHTIPSAVERAHAVERLLADFAVGGTLGEGRDNNGHSDLARASNAPTPSSLVSNPPSPTHS